MAVGRIHQASIERAGTRSFVSIGDDPSRSASKILKSMTPVIRSQDADPNHALEPEYEFIFQSGRDSIVFRIRVCGDKLCYRVGNVDYEGGNSADFLSIVKPLFQ